ncbi:MAG: SCO1664 family protein [Egibacteraceae bacterium]
MSGLLGRLASGELQPRGFLVNASNRTLLAQVGPRAWGLHAIYKPRGGERPLWDFPPGTLCQRETAAWVVSDFLGWGIVPPTVLRDGPLGEGSVQLFIPHNPGLHYFTLVEDGCHHRDLARMATFDLLTNNADRKASHVLFGDDGRLYGVDHGVCFHVQAKLRTVIWTPGLPPAPAGRPSQHPYTDRTAAARSDGQVSWRQPMLRVPRGGPGRARPTISGAGSCSMRGWIVWSARRGT